MAVQKKTLVDTVRVADLQNMHGVHVLSIGPIEFPAPAKVMKVEPLNGFFAEVTVGEDIQVRYALPLPAPVTLAPEGGIS